MSPVSPRYIESLSATRTGVSGRADERVSRGLLAVLPRRLELRLDLRLGRLLRFLEAMPGVSHDSSRRGKKAGPHA